MTMKTKTGDYQWLSVSSSVPQKSEGQKELHCVFVALDKAYKCQEEMWYCTTKSGIAEKYVRQVQDMQDSGEVCGRRCRWVQGGTEITSGIGTERLHFCIGLGQVDRWVQAVSTMMFDIMACSESR